MTATGDLGRDVPVPSLALLRVELVPAMRLAGAMIAAATAVAVVVRVSAVDAARAWLELDFPGIPNRLGEVAPLFLNNLSLLGAVLAACLVVHFGRLRPGRTRRQRALTRIRIQACDGAVLFAVVRHVVVVGAAVGAYGGQTLAALLPHGPVELASYSLALALFVNAHRGPLTGERCLAVAVLATLGLALSAFLEVFL